MRLKIYPYKLGSKSAKTLSRALGCKRIVPGGGYQPGRNTLVINWGSSSVPQSYGRILNKPDAVEIAANKLSTFYLLAQNAVAIPEFTTYVDDAREWQRMGYRVVVRHTLTAHSGQGIQIVRPDEELPTNAPLYTKYVRKNHEYRVHVFQGEVIDLSEKKRRLGVTPENSLVRNHKNGWVFCRAGVNPPSAVITESVRAVRSLRLDFGAVDIIERDGRVCVLEVNTAPGLEGTTLEHYVKAIRQYTRG
jgi:glutathione synthase/RimK-type ligase-like ATP-grasp enzyme